MNGPVPEEDPRPRDILADDPTGEEDERFVEQEQQPEPESWEAPDAG